MVEGRRRQRTSSKADKSTPQSKIEAGIGDGSQINIDEQFVKAFIWGISGCGTTYGAMSLIRELTLKGKPVVIFNTDVVENIKDNMKLFTEEERKLIHYITDEDGEIMVIDSYDKWNSAWAKAVEKYGDFSECAGVVLDFYDTVYDAYIEKWNPQTPFAYRPPRDKLWEQCIEPLIKAKTNTIINGKAKPIYIDVGQGDQFKKHFGDYEMTLLDKWRIPFNLIAYRQLRNAGDFENEHFRTVLTKHKLGLKPLIIEGDDSNLLPFILNFLKKKQVEIRKAEKKENKNSEAKE